MKFCELYAQNVHHPTVQFFVVLLSIANPNLKVQAEEESFSSSSYSHWQRFPLSDFYIELMWAVKGVKKERNNRLEEESMCRSNWMDGSSDRGRLLLVLLKRASATTKFIIVFLRCCCCCWSKDDIPRVPSVRRLLLSFILISGRGAKFLSTMTTLQWDNGICPTLNYMYFVFRLILLKLY